MYTTRFTNEGAFVYYNDNGPQLSTFVSNVQIAELRNAAEGKVDPETCVELKAQFSAQSDCEAVRFTTLNESDYRVDLADAIDAVACVLLPYLSETAGV